MVKFRVWCHLLSNRSRGHTPSVNLPPDNGKSAKDLCIFWSGLSRSLRDPGNRKSGSLTLLCKAPYMPSVIIVTNIHLAGPQESPCASPPIQKPLSPVHSFQRGISTYDTSISSLGTAASICPFLTHPTVPQAPRSIQSEHMMM